MDLGIRGRKAIVCASSQGLGEACARALAREGVSLVVNGRDEAKLAAIAASIAEESGVSVKPVAADLNDQAERERLIDSCPDADILVNNNAGPPPGNFLDMDHAKWLEALEANLLAPAMMIRGLLPGMQERGFGRIVNITSAMVKTPVGLMALSTTARTGLTALCKSISKGAAKHNVTINNLLPERIDTPRQEQMAQVAMKIGGITYEEARRQQVDSIAAGRLGLPGELADACAFLCSVQASFISGQNLQIDGGSYDGLI
ncbi:MAG: 3-oxoacyl-ACP reductase [Deltaproteobacteria bacterium]|nr:3-oxoacyl-ACP reductase [Deltaproteobacteria bacterium]